MNKQIELIYRGENLKQIIQVDDELKNKIIELEKECEILCHELQRRNQPFFAQKNQQLVIELMRTKNGKMGTNLDILEINYESAIEIGVENSEEYFPNTSIPIWKCKSEWFQKIGYLTRRNIAQLEKMITSIVKEMLDDKEGE